MRWTFERRLVALALVGLLCDSLASYRFSVGAMVDNVAVFAMARPARSSRRTATAGL